MKWYHWLWAPLAIGGVFLAYILGRRHGDAVPDIATELEVIDAKAKAKRWKAKLDAECARQLVEDEYVHAINKLDTKARDRARQLRADPVALAAFLARAGRGSG